MAGVNPQILTNSLNRARTLINDANFNNLVERNAKKNNNIDDLGNYAYKSNSMPKKSTNLNNLPKESFANSKLPKEILDELYTNPIDTNVGNGSMIEQLLSPLESSNVPITNESAMPQKNMVQVPNVVNNIDYTIIKAIIDESVKRNLSEMLGNIGNDLKIIKINKGNKIQLIDTKGNLYESTLSLKANINEIKK